MRTYEAALTHPENVKQVKWSVVEINRIGGAVEISAPTPAGVTLVVVTLPEIYRIEDVLPGLPFYPV